MTWCVCSGHVFLSSSSKNVVALRVFHHPEYFQEQLIMFININNPNVSIRILNVDRFSTAYYYRLCTRILSSMIIENLREGNSRLVRYTMHVHSRCSPMFQHIIILYTWCTCAVHNQSTYLSISNIVFM